MTAIKSQTVGNAGVRVTESSWAELRTELEQQREAIRTEIANYPPPIAGCDAQFNYLLEERTRITQELNRLNRLHKQSLASSDPARFLEEFTHQSISVNP